MSSLGAYAVGFVMRWLICCVVMLQLNAHVYFQSVIFHVKAHPHFPWFKQCVDFNFFPTPTHRLIYNLFHMLAMYGFPLIIMTWSYTLILIEISKKTKQSRGKSGLRVNEEMNSDSY